jgi:tRNA splicing endonuclease
MEENLFKKYKNVIEKQKNQKQILITYIQEKTTIQLQENDFLITKTVITFQVSSIIRSKLLQKNIYKHLLDKGYTVMF